MEKEAYNGAPNEAYANGHEPPKYNDPASIVEGKGIRVGEAADMYGDIGTAEEYGYVSRG